MVSVSTVELTIESPGGKPAGTFTLFQRQRARPRPGIEPLWDLRGAADRDASLAPIQVLEGDEYLYKLVLHEDGAADLSPKELFDPDDATGRRGRLRPREHTGTIVIEVRIDGREIGSCRIEVRSRKLGYLNDYRWMLSGLANEATEILMQRFSPAQLQRFVPELGRDARVLYQRFAFLQSLLQSGSLESALNEILRRPDHRFALEEELRSPSRGIPLLPDAARQLTGPGPRIPWPARPAGHALQVLPRQVCLPFAHPTVDTEANRFVKFALENWRRVLSRLEESLQSSAATHPIERGLREVGAAIDRLDSYLAEELFREVTALRHFPMANQVLERREGYREVYRVFFVSEVASRLSWDGGEDIYGAGQRDVATLYEYWVFLELARIVSRCCEGKVDRAALFKVSENGVTLGLRRGRPCLLSGEVTLLGRVLTVELWFNRTFGAGESWTRTMKPDCSLRISCMQGYRGEPIEVWLHFDAKYRVEELTQILGDEEDADGENPNVSQSRSLDTARRADLLKMHAYRDAIHRSAGAYVLYPGRTVQQKPPFRKREEYHEILPGLGAFVLRPTETGQASPAAAGALEHFLRGVLRHLAHQASRRERAEFWTERSYEHQHSEVDDRAPVAPFLEKPPADTRVLLGFTKEATHLEWIVKNRLYNLRADGRTGSVGLDSAMLSAELLLLYGPGTDRLRLWKLAGPPLVLTRERMLEIGYSQPKGDLYLCLSLAQELDESPLKDLTMRSVELVRQGVNPSGALGEPVVTTWSHLTSFRQDPR